MDNLEKEVRALIARVAKVPDEKLTDESNLFSDLGVDSLIGVEIFAALDKKYGLDIPESKLRDVSTVRDIIELVRYLKG
jgi:acyl carrier protein